MRNLRTILILLFVYILLTTSCLTNKKSFSNYGERMFYAKLYFPELYELYTRGEIIITDVYKYEHKGEEKIGISYRYRYR